MNSFFCNVLFFRSSRSQIFFKIDVLKISASFTGKQLCWSLFLIKLLVHRCFPLKLTEFFYEQLLLQNTSGGWFCGFSSKNNIISSVIMITLGYNKKIVMEILWLSSPFLTRKYPSSIKRTAIYAKKFVVFPAKVQTSWHCHALIISIFLRGIFFAYHFVEMFAINEWKLKRSILNRLRYKKIKLWSNSLLEHFSYVTFLRTILINASKILLTRQKLLIEF